MLGVRRAHSLNVLRQNRPRQNGRGKIVARRREEIRWERLNMRDLVLKYNGILGLTL